MIAKMFYLQMVLALKTNAISSIWINAINVRWNRKRTTYSGDDLTEHNMSSFSFRDLFYIDVWLVPIHNVHEVTHQTRWAGIHICTHRPHHLFCVQIYWRNITCFYHRSFTQHTTHTHTLNTLAHAMVGSYAGELLNTHGPVWDAKSTFISMLLVLYVIAATAANGRPRTTLWRTNFSTAAGYYPNSKSFCKCGWVKTFVEVCNSGYLEKRFTFALAKHCILWSFLFGRDEDTFYVFSLAFLFSFLGLVSEC